MKKDQLPEEKLLTLIRKDKKAFSKFTSKSKALLKIMAFFSNLIEHFILRVGAVKIMIFLLGMAVLFLILALIFPLLESPRSIKIKTPVQQTIRQLPQVQEAKSVNFYLERISKSNIFNLASLKRRRVPLDIFKDIALVGIISEEPPQAIIQHKKNKNTYFLKKGEMLGEYKLLEILEGKVIIEFEGEEFEIYL